MSEQALILRNVNRLAAAGGKGGGRLPVTLKTLRVEVDKCRLGGAGDLQIVPYIVLLESDIDLCHCVIVIISTRKTNLIYIV